MSEQIVYTLVVGHFVADFVCQTDWMALNKSKRWDALGWHVLVYSMVLGVFAAVTQPPSAYPYTTLKLFILWWLANAGAHFAQDALTSRLTSRLWFFTRADGIWTQAEYTQPKHGRTLVNPWEFVGGNRHWFFVAIGFDQLLHYVTLFVTAQWWLQ